MRRMSMLKKLCHRMQLTVKCGLCCSVVGHFCPLSTDDATELKEGDVAKM